MTIDEFKKLELRTAEILEAKNHPDADRLYVLRIKVGEAEKQVVAGIKKGYTLESLIGKKVVVVNNLEPAVIRGVESQGMLLAASDADRIVLLSPDQDIPSGSPVR